MVSFRQSRTIRRHSFFRATAWLLDLHDNLLGGQTGRRANGVAATLLILLLVTGLIVCAREERILVSHDFRTMPRHFREFVTDHVSPGVFLIAQGSPVGSTVEELLLICLGGQLKTGNLWTAQNRQFSGRPRPVSSTSSPR
jgi:hypothetical protein